MDKEGKNIIAPGKDSDGNECDTDQAFIELHNRIDDIAERIKGSDLTGRILDNERKAQVTFNNKAQLDYLLALAASGRMGDSAAFAGVSFRTVQRYRADNEDFAEMEDSVREIYRDKIRTAIEEEGIEGSLIPIILKDSQGAESIEGWRRVRNPKILELAAKLMLPEYRDRLEITGGLEIKVGVLAVTTGPRTEEDWSDRHGGQKLSDNRLTVDQKDGKVDEKNDGVVRN